MHARIASLPMYLANRPAVAALWELLRQALDAAGLDAEQQAELALAASGEDGAE